MPDEPPRLQDRARKPSPWMGWAALMAGVALVMRELTLLDHTSWFWLTVGGLLIALGIVDVAQRVIGQKHEDDRG